MSEHNLSCRRIYLYIINIIRVTIIIIIMSPTAGRECTRPSGSQDDAQIMATSMRTYFVHIERLANVHMLSLSLSVCLIVVVLLI